jgi:hypothetical protein
MSRLCKIVSAVNGLVGFVDLTFGTPTTASAFFLAAIMFQLWSNDE